MRECGKDGQEGEERRRGWARALAAGASPRDVTHRLQPRRPFVAASISLSRLTCAQTSLREKSRQNRTRTHRRQQQVLARAPAWLASNLANWPSATLADTAGRCCSLSTPWATTKECQVALICTRRAQTHRRRSPAAFVIPLAVAAAVE